MNQANQYQHGHAVEELKSLAAGRWFDILIAAGIDADKLNGKGHPCPKCGGRDRFAAFPTIKGRGAVHCRHGFTRGTDPSPGDGIASLQWILGLDFRATLGWLADYLGCKPSQRINFRGPQRVIASDDRNATREPATDFDDLAKRYFVEMSRERREGLANPRRGTGTAATTPTGTHAVNRNGDRLRRRTAQSFAADRRRR